MTTTISEKRKRFNALLARSGLMPQKQNILSGYGADSTTQLLEAQLDQLITYLESEVQYGNLKDYQWALFSLDNSQHKYILSLCQEHGWTVYDEKRQRTIADLRRLGAWIRNRAKIKKPLRQQSKKELQTTIYQLEQMVKKQFKHE